MRLEQKILFPHIERTGGTSVEAWFKQVFSPEHVLFYSPITDTLIRGSAVVFTHPLLDGVRTALSKASLMSLVHKCSFAVLQWQKHRHIQIAQLPHNFSVISGHFAADRFQDVVPNAWKAIILREPLERMISYWVYYRSMRGNVNHRVRIPYDPRMTFEDLAFHPQLQNYQTQALGSYDLDDFDLVGITSHLPIFAAQLLKMHGLENNFPLPRLHVSPNPNHGLCISQTFVEKFQIFHCRDYENYWRAQEMLRLA